MLSLFNKIVVGKEHGLMGMGAFPGVWPVGCVPAPQLPRVLPAGVGRPSAAAAPDHSSPCCRVVRSNFVLPTPNRNSAGL